MKKLKYSIQRKSLEAIYLTFVRPNLEYACIIWNDCAKYESDMLEKLQLDAACIVTGAKMGTSQNQIYEECGWPILSVRS